MFYTYVLLSEVDGRKYIGYTNNLEKRLLEHKKGEAESTKLRRPFRLIYFEACLNKYDAIKREKYFKTGFGRRFINNRIKSFLEEV